MAIGVLSGEGASLPLFTVLTSVVLSRKLQLPASSSLTTSQSTPSHSLGNLLATALVFQCSFKRFINNEHQAKSGNFCYSLFTDADGYFPIAIFGQVFSGLSVDALMNTGGWKPPPKAWYLPLGVYEDSGRCFLPVQGCNE